MTTKPLTVPLAQAALHNSKHRPPPLRSLPWPALEPDRQYVDKPAPEAAEVAGKKKRKKKARVTDDMRVAALARVAKLVSDGSPSTEAVATVAKELGVSASVIYRWRAVAKQTRSAANGGEKETAPAFDGLDLILDILDLCERAKKGLTRSQRVRLKAAVNERL